MPEQSFYAAPAREAHRLDRALAVVSQTGRSQSGAVLRARDLVRHARFAGNLPTRARARPTGWIRAGNAVGQVPLHNSGTEFERFGVRDRPPALAAKSAARPQLIREASLARSRAGKVGAEFKDRGASRSPSVYRDRLTRSYLRQANGEAETGNEGGDGKGAAPHETMGGVALRGLDKAAPSEVAVGSATASPAPEAWRAASAVPPTAAGSGREDISYAAVRDAGYARRGMANGRRLAIAGQDYATVAPRAGAFSRGPMTVAPKASPRTAAGFVPAVAARLSRSTASDKGASIAAAATEAANPASSGATNDTPLGDVYLDGALLGKWLARTLTREIGRPPTGGASFDGRRTAMLPGRLIVG